MSDQDRRVSPIHRHGEPKPFQMAIGDSENIEAISRHIERFVGKPATVFHELISDKVHIDVHIVEPSEQFPWYTLVTSGMSDRPMRAPEQCADRKYAELFLCLPADWKMGQEDWKSEACYWPIKALKFLARFPHQYDTWLWYGHTIPNGDPPEPFHELTKLCSFILLRPQRVPVDFHTLKIEEEKTIHFFAVVPLYADELAFKLQNGAEAVENSLVAAGYSELIAPVRESVIPKTGFFRRLFGGKK